MIKKEDYAPDKSKIPFIDKTIFTLLMLLSKFRALGTVERYDIKINAVLKVVFSLLLIILVSLSRALIFVLIINAFLLILLSFFDTRKMIDILKLTFFAVIFSAIIMLPSFIMSNKYSLIIIALKVFSTVTMIGLLSHTTSPGSINGALKYLFLPDIFIFLLDITIKFTVLLGELSLNMFYALKLRAVGDSKNKYKPLSGIAGTMFIKSKEMADDMYTAMVCRGFTGEYQIKRQFKISPYDIVFILINMIFILLFVYYEIK